MSMSEASKKVLRHQVLELRGAYRIARERWLSAKKEIEIAHSTCQVLRDSIRVLQVDCGDPIDIDPSHPEDDVQFEPIAIGAADEQETSHERAGAFTNGDPK